MPERKTKRAPKGSGTIFKHPNGSWVWRRTIGRDPGTGKYLTKDIYCKTQAEAAKIRNKTLAEIDEGTYAEPSKMTLGVWLDIFLADYMGDKKISTYDTYEINCRVHLKPALGAVRLSDLKPPMIQKAYNSFKNGKDPTKLSNPKTVKNIHGTLHKALSVAVKVGHLKHNPADAITLPRITKKEIQPLTDAQVSVFIKTVGNDVFATLFKVIAFTGLRKSEALGLTWNNINFETGIITVEKQLLERSMKNGVPVLDSLKNDKPRRITPAPFVMDLLKAHEVTQKKMRLQAGSAWQSWTNEKERKAAFVFTNELGRYLPHKTVSKRYKKIVASIGIPGACVHDLRHTYATISLQQGDNVKTVQENLGHHDAAFTLNVYGHVSEKMRQDSANRMQNYIQSVSAG